MTSVRALGPGDEAGLEAFLVQHADSSMFLRANVRAAGLVEHGGDRYVAAFEGEPIVAVAAHRATYDTILLQAPVALDAVVQTLVSVSARPVRGFIGPWAQVVAARAALALDRTPARMASREWLYALDLDHLIVPPGLAAGRVRCRRPTAADLGLIGEWRAAYSMEELRIPDGPDLRARARKEVEHLHAEGAHWLLEQSGQPVAYSAFNARLPDMVQVGGVWTPPMHRRRGHARSIVAGSLIEARQMGARRAILFTGESNVPAQRAYEALGFQRVGDYGLVFLA